MRQSLLTSNGYSLYTAKEGALLLARDSHVVCRIIGYCADRLQSLLSQLQTEQARDKFALEVNCHGLSEFMLGRSLKWRNAPKRFGLERIPLSAPLPSPLPAVYQLLNGAEKVMHSVPILGNAVSGSNVYVLEKLHSCGLHIETYAQNLQYWARSLFPPQGIRLRYPSDAVEESRRAA